jgi:hypothetical protein
MSEIKSSLKECAILVDFDGGYWNWQRRDTAVEREVRDTHSLTQSAGKYLKNLFLGADRDLHAIRQCVQAARDSNDHMTLPWQDGYARLLHNTNFMTYTERQARHRADLDNAKTTFAASYDEALRDARSNLNSLFDPSQYPTIDDILSRCYIQHRFMPLSDEKDVRIQADAATVEAIKADVKAAIEERYSNAAREPFERLHRILTTAVANLQKNGTPGSRFHTEWYDHLTSLLDVLPGLNLNADPDLDRIAVSCRKLLSSATADDLKVSLDCRAKLAQQAQSIYDDLSSMFTPSEVSK